MSTQTLDEIFGFAPKKRTAHPLDEVFGVAKLNTTPPSPVSEKEALESAGLTSGMDPLKDVGRYVIGSVYDPALQMGLGGYNTTVNPLLGRESTKNIPSFANLTGDASAPNIAAPGYDQQGNYIGGLKAAEQMVGATGMTALNIATLGRGKMALDATKAAGKYAIGKTTPVLSRMLGASAREGTVGAGYGASSAMSEGGDVGDVLKSTAIGTGIGVAGGATLAGGSSALGKLDGVSEKLVDDAINLERAGDKAGAAAARATPEYQQFIKANNLTDAEIIKKTDLQLAELKKFEDEGIGRSRSASTAGKQARKQNKIQDEQRESFVKYARESSEATDANIADYSQVVGNSRQNVIDTARVSKAEVMPLTVAEAPSFIKRVVNEMSSDGMYGTDRVRAQKALTDDLIARIDQVKAERRNFDIGDYYNWKTSSNKSFGNESFGGALDTAIGNVIRRDLRSTRSSATGKETKAILNHLIESDNQLSSLKQAGEYNKFLQTLGQGRPSRLLNLFAGFGLSGGNPVAGIGIAMMTQGIQQRILASRGNRIYRGLTGKIKSGTTDELIGNSANVVKMLKEKGIERSQERKMAKALAGMTREYSKSVKKEEIDRVSKLLRLPARATPAPIQLGGGNYLSQKLDASGKIKGSMEGFATTQVSSIMAALAGLGITGVAAEKKLREMGFGTATYQRESDPVTEAPKQNPRLSDNIGFVESRGEKSPYTFSQWSDLKQLEKSPLGKALGKYQITEARLSEKSKNFLGRVVGKEEFLSSPELQEKFINSQIQWLRGHGLTDEEILGVHRFGWGNLKPEQIKKSLDKAREEGYVQTAMTMKEKNA